MCNILMIEKKKLVEVFQEPFYKYRAVLRFYMFNMYLLTFNDNEERITSRINLYSLRKFLNINIRQSRLNMLQLWACQK